VQYGHFVALIDISILQYGHSFVVGIGAGTISGVLNLFIDLTKRKITMLIIRKDIT